MQASENAAGSPGVKKYKVVSPLHHDGKRREIGEQVWLSADQAAPLLGSAVEPIAVESAQEAIARRVAEKQAGG